jgi:hypothetical protein
MNFLKIVAVILGVASFCMGIMLHTKNTSMANEISGGKTVEVYSATDFKTAAAAAFATAGIALCLAFLVFMKNPKLLVAFALFTIVCLIISYYLQPEYAKVEGGPATSKEVALIQLFLGNIAAFAAIMFARQKTKEQL